MKEGTFGCRPRRERELRKEDRSADMIKIIKVPLLASLEGKGLRKIGR